MQLVYSKLIPQAEVEPFQWTAGDMPCRPPTRLRAQDEIPGEVSLWKTGFCAPPGAPKGLRLESREGGRELTDAFSLYAQSFGWPESERIIAYTTVLTGGSSVGFVRSSNPALGRVVSSACALQDGGSRSGTRNVPCRSTSLPCFQRLQSTLDSLRGLPGRKWTSGMGLMEISPVAADAELEFALGRPRQMVAGD